MEGDEMLKLRFSTINVMYIRTSASPHLIDPMGLRVAQNAYFSHLIHTKQVLLVKYYDNTAKIEGSLWDTRKHRQTDGQTDVEVEIVI